MLRRLICLVFLLSLPALAQRGRSTDWAVVEQLPAGERIEIRTTHQQLRCAFIGADNASLSCHVSATHSLFLSVPAHDEQVSRAEVRTVRNIGRKASTIGLVVGAGAGFALGAAQDGSGASRVAGGLIGGLFGGFLGYALGGFFDLVGDLFQTGVVYKQP